MAIARMAPNHLTLGIASIFASQDDAPEASLMRSLEQRRGGMATEQQRFAQICDRFDKLYYAEDFTNGGADHWAEHPSAKTPGKAHVSVNTPAAYVDIPAALQSVEPVENIMATENSQEARTLASGIERIFCVTPDTRVLTSDLRWLPAGDLAEGDGLWAFDEEIPEGAPWRSWQLGKVTHTGRVPSRTVAVTLSTGEVLTSTPDHKWLVTVGRQKAVWVEAKDLLRGQSILRYVQPWVTDESREAGWVAGFMDGEGCIGASGRRTHRTRLNDLSYAQKPGVVLDTAMNLLALAGWRQSTHLSKSGIAEVRINGAAPEVARFLGTYRPERLLRQFVGGALRYVEDVRVVSVEDAGVQDVITLTSSTGTYFAEGFAAHNTAWKQHDDFDLKFAQVCTVKALYGRSAAKVYWKAEDDYPCVEIIDQPRNLYLGWSSTDYKRLDWAAYTYRLSPTEVLEEYGLDCTGREYEGKIYPMVLARPMVETSERPSRTWLSFGPAMIECWDYWYRLPKNRTKAPVVGKRVEMETWNAVFIGNVLAINARHPEYDGKMPYIPVFNSYIPGVPDGRAELYDMEQLIREKDERITAGAQMIGSTVAGQFWQLTGPEAPDRIPPGAKPKLNEVAAPGAGNRIEAITPFIPQFQLESFLARLDREMSAVSGLNDLLLGLAPASVLSSSKAINALIANYEAHIAIKRMLLYKWRRAVIRMVTDVWQNKSTVIRELMRSGYFLDIRDPSLTPRDDLETATMAVNLLNNKVWSAKRAMDATNVDDPEQEQDIIREEQTDAALNPSAVAVMAQLMQTLAALQQPPPQEAQQVAGEQLASLQNNFRQMGAGIQGAPSMQGAELQGQMPPEALTPPAGGGLPPSPPPDLMGPAGPEAGTPTQAQPLPPQLQTMLQGGQVKSRIVSKRNVPQK